VTRLPFGRPPGDPATLVCGEHWCALGQDQDQDQGERRPLTAASVRGALAPGGAVMVES
jgi:hypothetical protein